MINGQHKLTRAIQERSAGRYLASVSMVCFSTMGMFGYSGDVGAQDAELRALEEVVVTARRREESIQDVPIAVTAMNEDFLRVQNVHKIADLGTKVPSLRISSAGASQNEPLISLRGQRPAETAFNQDQAVAMYFNDIVIAPSQGSNLGMYDLENVQVLKGPQGTLFGRNSTGGAILMTAKRPGTEVGGYADVKVGDYNLMGFEGAVDVPITDNLQIRLAGHKLDRDGYQKNVADNALNGDDYNDEHSQGARISVNFDMGKLNNLLVLAQDENRVSAAVPLGMAFNSSVGLGFVAGLGMMPGYVDGVERNIARNDPWKVETDIDSEEYVRNTFFSNTTEFEINDNLTAKNIFGYRKVIFETATDVDGTAFPGFGAPTLGAPGATHSPIPGEITSEFFSDEIQLLGSAFDDRMDWIAGVYWSKTNATQDYTVQQSPALGGGSASYDTGITSALNTSYGAFGEATWNFSDAWSVTAGVRQSWDEREMTVAKWRDLARSSCNIVGPGGGLAVNCEREVEDDFDAATWRASLNFKPIDNVLLYGSVSTGYRAGGFNTRGNDDGTLMPFDAEEVTTYELGSKADWDFAGMPLRTNVALYWQDYEDIHQTRSFDNNGLLASRTENAGEAEIKGAELELTLMPVDSVQLGFSYSFVDAQYGGRTPELGDIDSDSVFAYIPEHSLTVSAAYTLPIDASLGEMSLMASLYWQDEMFTHPLVEQFGDLPGRTTPRWSAEDVAALTEASIEDSYSVWNLRFDWRSVMGSNFDFAAYVNNAGDEDYVTGGLNVVDSGGYLSQVYGAPRTIGASLRYTF